MPAPEPARVSSPARSATMVIVMWFAARRPDAPRALERGLGALLCVAVSCGVSPISSRAVAQSATEAPHLVWIAGSPEGEAAGRARRWSRRVARAIEGRGVPVYTEAEAWAYEAGGDSHARVQTLVAVEAAIVRAQRARARLDEARALAALDDAHRALLRVLDVPGSTQYLAEIELARAATAAQLGDMGVAEAALRRALTLDPERGLRAAEAPPDLVARADAIANLIALGARGSFVVRCAVPEAEVWIDDRRVGPAPARLDLAVGTHIVRVSAPGHLPYAALIDVLAGPRASMEVVLSAEPGTAAARALRDAIDREHEPAIVSALELLGRSESAPASVWLVEVGQGPLERAVVRRCTTDGCEAPMRIDESRVESVLPAEDAELRERSTPTRVAAARAWLEEPLPVLPPPPAPPEFWQQPWPWVVLGVVVAGAAAAAIGTSIPQATDIDNGVGDGTRFPLP